MMNIEIDEYVRWLIEVLLGEMGRVPFFAVRTNAFHCWLLYRRWYVYHILPLYSQFLSMCLNDVSLCCPNDLLLRNREAPWLIPNMPFNIKDSHFYKNQILVSFLVRFCMFGGFWLTIKFHPISFWFAANRNRAELCINRVSTLLSVRIIWFKSNTLLANWNIVCHIQSVNW